MINDRIPGNYSAVWQIIGSENYKVDKNGILVNLERGKILKRKVKGYSIGYNINGKFCTLKSLRARLEKIGLVDVPF